MANILVFTEAEFPYTFPFTFGEADKAVQAAAYEPVLPIEYRYTLPDFFLVQEPTTWHGYQEAWQNQSTTIMPIWRVDVRGADADTYPYIFGGTSLDQLFDEADLTWYSQPATLMPEYYPRDLYGLYDSGMSGGNWAVMQLSTPIFLPDGTAVTEPTHIKLSSVGTGRTQTRIR
jgi:hypothetical protein